VRLLLVVMAAVSLFSCVKPKPLEVLSTVPQFRLIAEDGQPFDSQWLDGHIWVADFIYTTCDGPCPMMSSQMRRIQDQTAAEMPDVRFISITVDPVHDTPPVLLEYAKHFMADFKRWRFLTGEQSMLNNLALNGFKLNGVDGSMTHSTRFVLVDARRRIRGYYVTGQDGFMPKLMHDIRQLKRFSS
jgi:protein SCO1/2